jgi:hypothetical protein
LLIQNPQPSPVENWASQEHPCESDSKNLVLSRSVGFWAGLFFVSVPVLCQAPLVRLWPWVSLAATLPWLLGGYLLLKNKERAPWGDLIFGFSWSWLAGSLYWGWLRLEPLWHLPIEAIGLPFALFSLWRGYLLVGHCFYLGSLFGTAITDFYFYALGLLPDWRRIMKSDLGESILILHQAAEKIQTLEGVFWAVVLVSILLVAGIAAFRVDRLHWSVFSGAVLGTLIVDALFGLSALL